MTKQLDVSPETWNEEFSSGRWDCLDNNPAERARHAIIGMYCCRYFPNGSVLDVGCGEGTLVDFLRDKQKDKYLGIDISSEAIKIAKRKRKGLAFQCISAEMFESNKKFDVIVFNEVLYYMDDIEILRKYSGFFKDKGLCILSLYSMKSERHDKAILRNSRKLFKPLQAVEVSGEAGGQKVIWRIDLMSKKNKDFDIHRKGVF